VKKGRVAGAVSGAARRRQEWNRRRYRRARGNERVHARMLSGTRYSSSRRAGVMSYGARAWRGYENARGEVVESKMVKRRIQRDGGSAMSASAAK